MPNNPSDKSTQRIEVLVRSRLHDLKEMRGDTPIYNQGSSVSRKGEIDARIQELERVLRDVLGVSVV